MDPTPTPDDAVPAAHSTNQITQAIWDALSKQGVPERQRNVFLASALGLSYSQARRKLNGESEWTSRDLQTLAGVLGVPVSDLVGNEHSSLSSQPSAQANEASEKGLLMLDGLPVPCVLEVGETLPADGFCEFVAVGVAGAWTVWHHARLPVDAGRGRRVLSLQLAPRQDRPITIAVLDDNQAAADSVADLLTSSGLLAQTFYTSQALREALKHNQFDGYILDWRLSQAGSETAHAVINHIRQDLNSAAPIFVLTGVDPNDEPVLSDLEREIATNRIRLAFKPYKLRLLLTDLKQAVASARLR